MRRAALVTIVVITFIVVAIAVSIFGRRPVIRYTGPVEKIRLGMSIVGPERSALIFIAQELGYFKNQGLEVLITMQETGQIAQQGMQQGKFDIVTSADFAFVSDTVVASPLKAKVLAVIDKSNIVEVVGRKDRGINKPADLKGKKIAVALKTQHEFYLSRFLTYNNISFNDVKIVNLTPADSKDAIISGQTDAAIDSDPFVSQIKQALGINAMSWPAQAIEDNYWLISGSDEFIGKHPQTVERFVQALVEAEDYLQKNPSQAQEFLAKTLNINKTSLATILGRNKYGLSLDQSLLLVMEDDARWRIDNKLTDKTNVPNYLDFIYFDALEAVKPEAITIIR